MSRLRFLILFFCMSVVVLGGCGGSTMPAANVPTGSATASLSIRDMPPQGTTVLSFQITLSGATLQPGNVPLINSPVNIELKKLETETAFLNLTGVPAGTYTSIQLVFANPRLTILNNSGTSIGSCQNGQLCRLEPPLNSATVNFSGLPFPLTLNANSQVGLVLDFDLSKSIENNFSITPTVSLTLLPAVQGTGKIEELEFVGVIKSVSSSNNQVTIQNASSGLTLAVNVDNNTEFEDFRNCSARNITCLVVDQIVEVELILTSAGKLLAKEIELEGVAELQVEGIIVSVANPPTQFNMVVHDKQGGLNEINLGNQVTVRLAQNATFSVGTKDVVVPAGLLFESSADLQAGQQVQVRPTNVTSIGGPITMTTDRVRLRMSQFTARVALPGANSFAVDNLPGLFTAAGITTVRVVISPKTEFENVAGTTALAISDIVSLRGLLFRSPGTSPPILVAKKVRKR